MDVRDKRDKARDMRDERDNPMEERNGEEYIQTMLRREDTMKGMYVRDTKRDKAMEERDRKDIQSMLKRWELTTKVMKVLFDTYHCQPYSIAIVPDELRKWNEDAYIPKMVSIGPRYKGRWELLPMEEIKWRCMDYILNRTENAEECSQKCMEAILELDAAIRASYVNKIRLSRYDLATVMVYDGCFLLEILISGSKELDSKLPCSLDSPSPAVEMRTRKEVLNDLALLENQIPLFILTKLFEELFPSFEFDPNWSCTSIQDMALSLLGFHLEPDYSGVNLQGAHFLELASSHIQRQRKKDQRGQHESTVDITTEHVERLNRCATRLLAAGITIKPKSHEHEHGSSEFDIELTRNRNGVLVLEIPPLHITQTSEAKWRNFIAWELKRSSKERPCSTFTSSALLFHDLICCASDVQLLKDRGVIEDHLKKSNRDLVNFFHSLTKGVDRGIIDPKYSNKFDALNTNSATNCATKIPILVLHYFCRFLDWIYSLHKFLRRGYNFAAIIVTLLTAVQAAYAILAYHYPK
ncbi:hypothetical protein SESBI_03736 [Sesbania bispinosa]|nr:hypothetical protein SESBI_03736 [Sesbania bispinosa]